jgi:hypothetical protein
MNSAVEFIVHPSIERPFSQSQLQPAFSQQHTAMPGHQLTINIRFAVQRTVLHVSATPPSADTTNIQVIAAPYKAEHMIKHLIFVKR